MRFFYNSFAGGSLGIHKSDIKKRAMQYSVPATHDAVTQISGFSFKISRKMYGWRFKTVSKDSTLLKEACCIHTQQGEISAPPHSQVRRSL
jgi:hypothetical protein